MTREAPEIPMGIWAKAYSEARDSLSKGRVFCYCGKLMTGLHEQTCRTFIGKCRAEAVRISKVCGWKETLNG